MPRRGELNRLSADNAGRVSLMAHSSGAYLARALVARAPEQIGLVTICGGVWDLCTAVLRLGWRFVRSRRDADLVAAYRRAAEADTPQSYFSLFAGVSAVPGFRDWYWSPSALEPRKQMKALAQGRLHLWPGAVMEVVDAAQFPHLELPPSA